jgi:hypothetical protein
MAASETTPESIATAQLTAPPGRQTLSQLIAKILDQLSVSAWLPAGVLIFLVLLIGNARASEGDVGRAVGALGHLSAPSLLLLFVGVILATVLTQAFQFEAIQMLEGYWGTGRVRTYVAEVRSRRHLAKRNALGRRLQDVADSAFTDALSTMLAENVPPTTVDLVKRLHQGEIRIAQLSKKQRNRAANDPWEDYAPLRKLRRMDALAAAVSRFPSDDRAVRPTRLGNTLRAYEDPVEEKLGHPIEGFVQEVFHKLPATRILQITGY